MAKTDQTWINEDVNDLRKALGLPRTHKALPKAPRMVSLSGPAHQGLKDLAASHGYYYAHGPNLSGFLEALGLGLIKIAEGD